MRNEYILKIKQEMYKASKMREDCMGDTPFMHSLCVVEIDYPADKEEWQEYTEMELLTEIEAYKQAELGNLTTEQEIAYRTETIEQSEQDVPVSSKLETYL